MSAPNRYVYLIMDSDGIRAAFARKRSAFKARDGFAKMNPHTEVWVEGMRLDELGHWTWDDEKKEGGIDCFQPLHTFMVKAQKPPEPSGRS